MRCVRLAANTTVAHKAMTAKADPKSAVPTGTEAAPRPRSKA